MSDMLDLKIKPREVDGLEMGVMADGTSFLSQRGLAKLCGINRSVIAELRADPHSSSRRDKVLAHLLDAHGYRSRNLYTTVTVGGVDTYCYPEQVCMAVLEYYALDSERANETAKANYRLLARAGLRVYVYRALGLGFDGDSAKHFVDRLVMNPVPRGYFSVIKESAEFILGAIRAGVQADQHTVPDISVGQHWGRHWTNRGLGSSLAND